MSWRLFDAAVWSAVPFGFWCVVFFVFGTVVGSFLNVCIHRLPLGQSIVHPPSHCPHCHYSIPWYLNIPVVTWVYLRAKCRNCGARISARYFIVELLTGLLFLACWVGPGRQSLALALIYAGFLAGLVAAAFIDFEHLIVPDEITLGGMAAGFLCSGLAPRLQDAQSLSQGMKQSLVGMVAGAGIVYCILRLGKWLFGRHKIALPADTLIVFTETGVQWEGRQIPYEDLFYRPSDVIALQARRVEMVDRCYKDVPVRLGVSRLSVGSDEFSPESVPHLEAVCSEVVLPREAMGMGDVKFVGAIGAFLGWKAVLFCLFLSSVIGSIVGLTLIGLRKQSTTRLPFIPYLALAAALWVFGGHQFVAHWWKWRQSQTLGLVAQGVVDQDQRGHRLDNRNGAGQHAGVVAAPAFEGCVLEVNVNRVLRLHEGGDRFEGDTEINRLAVGNASLNAARTIGRGIDPAAFGPERVVVLRAREQNAAEAGAEIEAFGSRQTEHRLGQVRLEAVKDRLAPACRDAAGNPFNDAADRVARLARLFD